MPPLPPQMQPIENSAHDNRGYGVNDIPGFMATLNEAIESSNAYDHALLLLELDESPRFGSDGSLTAGEAETLLPQLAEIMTGSDMIASVSQGRYAILLQDCSMARMTRKIAAIDFLRSRYNDSFGHRGHGPTQLGSTYLREGDSAESAIARAKSKLDRFR